MILEKNQVMMHIMDLKENKRHLSEPPFKVATHIY